METLVVPNMRRDGFVELSGKPGQTQRKVTGRLFRKQILAEGSFIHPMNPTKKVVIDREFAEKLVENFNSGVCDIVQFPIVDGSNRHSEDPSRNLGEVVGLSYTPGKGVYADIDVRKHADDVGKTIIGGSAMISLGYRNNVTGEFRSPVLLHVAATNRPFLANLEGFQEVMSMSDTSDQEIVFLSEAMSTPLGGNAMSKDELIAALKEYGIDVLDLERRAAAVEDIAAFSNILDATDNETALSLSDLAEATVELDEKNAELTNQLTEMTAHYEELKKERDALKLSAAETEVDALIAAGRIFPKAREKMLELSMNDYATFEALVPDEPIVRLSEGQTVTTFDTSDDEEKLSSEIERYVANYANK